MLSKAQVIAPSIQQRDIGVNNEGHASALRKWNRTQMTFEQVNLLKSDCGTFKQGGTASNTLTGETNESETLMKSANADEAVHFTGRQRLTRP